MIDWASVFGGWPNVFQGVLSAVVSGLVAALTAWAVVRATSHVDRQRALEDEARHVARELTRILITTFIGVPDDRSIREDIEMAGLLNMELRTAAAVLARQDLNLAQRIQDGADLIADTVEDWKRNPSLIKNGSAPDRYNQIGNCVDDLHELIINWLGSVVPVRKPNRSA